MRITRCISRASPARRSLRSIARWARLKAPASRTTTVAGCGHRSRWTTRCSWKAPLEQMFTMPCGSTRAPSRCAGGHSCVKGSMQAQSSCRLTSEGVTFEHTDIAVRSANGHIQQTHRRYNADEYAGRAAHGHLRGVWLRQRAGEPELSVHHARGCAGEAAQCLWHTRLCHDGQSAYLG